MDHQEATTPKKPMTKTEIISSLSETTGLTREQVANCLDGLAGLIGGNLGEAGPGVFTIPHLLKIKVVRKAAIEARKGVNPFTKEDTVFKAKPARNVVKIIPLKALKDMV